MSRKRKKRAQKRNKTPSVARDRVEPAKDQVSSRQVSEKIETSMALSNKVKGYVERVRSFLREVRVEFYKVTWPSKKEIIAMTSAVLAITFFFVAYLGIVDISLTKLVSLFIY